MHRPPDAASPSRSSRRRNLPWPRPLPLLLDGEDVVCALGAGEQVLAVIGVEEFAKRLDTADDHQEIVLAIEREHGVHEIMTRALLAKLDFEAVGEEGQKID